VKLVRKAGDTSNILQIFIADSSSTTGGGLTGLVFNSGSLTAYYHRDTDTTATAMTLVTMTVGTFTSLGFKEIDATHMPGWYQFCPPDAALAAGAKSVAFHLQGASNMAPLPIEIQLVAIDVQDSVRAGLTALPNAAAEAAGGLYTRGTGAGQINQPANGEIDARVAAILSTVDLSTTMKTSVEDTVWDTTLASHVGAGSAAAALAAAAAVPDPLAVPVPGSYPSGTVGYIIGNNPDSAGVTTLLSRIASALNITSGAVDVHSLSSAAIQSIWDALTSALTTAGSIGKRLVDNIDVVLSTRATVAGVWDEDLTTHQTAGTAGKALTDASVAVVPNTIAASVWDRAISLITSAGSIGKFLQDQLDAAVSTRLGVGDYIAPDNTSITAIKAKTDNLPGSPAAVSDIPTATENADALLKRDMSAVTGESARSPLNAFRFLRNKWGVVGGTLTVTKEDDAAPAWTAAVSTDPAAVPITGSDPT
jgi:hypothetical protein